MSKDPVLRIFVIILLGVILFQMIFNLITGGNSMGEMSSSNMNGNGTTSLDNLAMGLIVLLIKFLIIVLLISIIIGVFMWMKNHYFNNINLSQYFKTNSVKKQILGFAGAIIGLFLLIYVYNYLVNPSIGYSSYMTSSNSTVNNNIGGFNGALGITGVVTFLIKVLTYVFLLSLIISLIAFIKKQLEAGGFHLFRGTNISNNNEVNSGNQKGTASAPDELVVDSDNKE